MDPYRPRERLDLKCSERRRESRGPPFGGYLMLQAVLPLCATERSGLGSPFIAPFCPPV